MLDIKKHLIADARKSVNFNNTICQYKKDILVIGQLKLSHVRILSWSEYIDKLRFSENVDGLKLLNVALNIFNGRIKGLALLPDTKEKREAALRPYMRNLLMLTIKAIVEKVRPTIKSDQNNNQKDLNKETSGFGKENLNRHYCKSD